MDKSEDDAVIVRSTNRARGANLGLPRGRRGRRDQGGDGRAGARWAASSPRATTSPARCPPRAFEGTGCATATLSRNDGLARRHHGPPHRAPRQQDGFVGRVPVVVDQRGPAVGVHPRRVPGRCATSPRGMPHAGAHLVRAGATSCRRFQPRYSLRGPAPQPGCPVAHARPGRRGSRRARRGCRRRLSVVSAAVTGRSPPRRPPAGADLVVALAEQDQMLAAERAAEVAHETRPRAGRPPSARRGRTGAVGRFEREVGERVSHPQGVHGRTDGTEARQSGRPRLTD